MSDILRIAMSKKRGCAVMYRTACEGGVVVAAAVPAAAVVADDTCGCGNRVEVLVRRWRRRRRTRAAWEACYEEGAVARSLLSSSGRRRLDCGRFAVALRFVMC